MYRRPARTSGRNELSLGLTTAADADAQGWTRSARRHAVTSGDLEQVRVGVVGSNFAPASAYDDADRRLMRSAQAATLCCSRAGISHTAAAISYGMPRLGRGRVCLTVQAGTALRSLAGVHLHRATIGDDESRIVGGYRTLSPARTIMDLSREFGVASGLVAADHALHVGLVEPDEVELAWERCAGWPGRKAARIVRALCDGASESPLESLSRLAMAANRLPPPELQATISTRAGQFVARSDFYWDEFGVIGEADGDLKYDDRVALVRERARQQSLEQLGLTVVRWRWADLADFEPVAARLRSAFRRGVGRDSPERRWLCTHGGRYQAGFDAG